MIVFQRKDISEEFARRLLKLTATKLGLRLEVNRRTAFNDHFMVYIDEVSEDSEEWRIIIESLSSLTLAQENQFFEEHLTAIQLWNNRLNGMKI